MGRALDGPSAATTLVLAFDADLPVSADQQAKAAGMALESGVGAGSGIAASTGDPPPAQ